MIFTGCSKVDWAIQWADTYIAWKINDQFDFDGNAKKTVKTESSKLVQEFRKKEFPKLSSLLSDGAQELSRLDFNDEEALKTWVTHGFDQADQFLDGLNPLILPFATRVSALVEKENWEAFQKNFEKENKKIEKEKSKCFSKLKDEVTDWIGSLQPSQKKALEGYCNSRSESPTVRVKNREHLIAKFRNWMGPDSEFSTEKFQAATRKWIQDYRQIQSAESEAQWKKSRPALIQALTFILKDASSNQRKKLIENLEDKAQSLHKLSL
jgi:hypothetical protein